jgi:cytosine/adenosine deaminase-related metal-dependent hydrolase
VNHTREPQPDLPQDPRHAAPLLRLDAACVAHAHAAHSPGSLLLDPASGTVLASGTPAAVDRAAQPQRPISTRTFPNSTLLPAFANAHTHLDLSDLGPRPCAGRDFDSWIGSLRGLRPTEPEAIAHAVRTGIALCVAGGVLAVGDIAGCPASGPTLTPWRTLRDSPLLGVSFVEFFGIGRAEASGLARVEHLLNEHAAEFSDQAPDGVRLGLQPHAPYSVAARTFERVARTPGEIPVSTHLAETLAEREFCARATGPRRAFLESLGLWTPALEAELSGGQRPEALIETALGAGPWVIAHANDATDQTIAVLARAPRGGPHTVCWCPRSSADLGNETALGPHRWRAMLDAGVNVCLATDSVLHAADTPDRLSPLDEARWVWRSGAHGVGGAEAAVLLGMITVRGGRALGLPASWFGLGAGDRPLGVVEIPGARDVPGVFGGSGAPRLLWSRKSCGGTGVAGVFACPES